MTLADLSVIARAGNLTFQPAEFMGHEAVLCSFEFGYIEEGDELRPLNGVGADAATAAADYARRLRGTTLVFIDGNYNPPHLRQYPIPDSLTA